MDEKFNPFAIAQQQLDRVAEKLGLDPALHELLRWPMQEIQVTLPVRMDNGSTKIFHAFRVQYNTARGPAKGGIRWHPQETIDTVRALAAWMTWKTSVVDIPLGGGKGGVVCDPGSLSQGELERLSRGYMRKARRPPFRERLRQAFRPDWPPTRSPTRRTPSPTSMPGMRAGASRPTTSSTRSS